MGVVGLVTAAVATIFLYPLALSGHLFSLEIADPADFVGNGGWQSSVYALWDSLFACGVFLAALTLFRRLFNGDSRFGRFLSQHSYGVYILHTPIIVFAAIMLKDVDLPALAKFCVLSVLVLPTCFIIAYLVRRLPLASQIL